ncbi:MULTISPECIES: wax ester/triacylglycerol synthase domain-containing protein [Streptomycetaceae]|uniref:O-acyltransferase WSD1-like N-terminal domain-containing protein n=1 Tax=Streptantibioticus cattleyicolor (strain ATCC 35852 / DSM 46488 / JCM 4925 / NBRC 14057 / NRRL 8057) TaxID=1003195 RepID=F8JSQ9_STREN|nr:MULTISPECIES: wax ester/triacylglycerol synthase domain-containing protein [Streptomycetaceae]AEW97964.1 hypothetical protein SCATT_55930 [Streptantibioticus cattleyicolor NRRL 8057 = DSM 46488]MYS62366.1 condensation protein [Streptomyces sp. SID5468]CCB78283.1 putative condensation domain protein [Streptantibioticus cattleyicolor NRRL 8057 = DSM 46488]
MHPQPRTARTVPLGAADLAFLESGGEKTLPTVFMLNFAGPPPTLDALRARVAERAGRVPVLGCRVTTSRRALERVERLDLTRHVRELSLPGPLDDGHIATRMLSRPLPGLDGPPWDLWLVHGTEGGYRVVLRAPHALQDGAGAAHTVRALLADEPGGGPPAHRPSRPRARGFLDTLGYVAAAFRDAGPMPAFAARPTGVTEVCHVDTPVARLRAIGRAVGGSVNDVYLAALAHAVHTWHAKENGAVHPPLPVVVPMSVRRAGEEHAPGNRMVTARLLLPCDQDSPFGALAAVMARTARLRRSGQRDATRLLMTATPRRIAANLGKRMVHGSTVAAVTSGVNLGDPFTYQGDPVVNAAVFTDAIAGVMCVAVLTGCGGNARFTFVHDRALPTADEIPDLWLASLLELDKAHTG